MPTTITAIVHVSVTLIHSMSLDGVVCDGGGATDDSTPFMAIESRECRSRGDGSIGLRLEGASSCDALHSVPALAGQLLGGRARS